MNDPESNFKQWFVLKRNWFALAIFFFLLCYSGSSYSQPDRLKTLISSNDLVYHSAPSSLNTGVPVGNGQFGGVLAFSENELTWQMNHTGFWRFYPKTMNHSKYGARPFGLGRLSIKWETPSSASKPNIDAKLGLYDAMFTYSLKPLGLSIENFFDMDHDCAVFKLQSESQKPIVLTIVLEAWSWSNSPCLN